ncbi:hypothetical protein [Noviherbaspirillum sedimenti]|uniref:Uncharacterized protein n=1 Tax=Noviherbaspirillum sedimenti TaxID=2320865 RepID=A0A3A3FYK8_9BURK|nr:hypothetical protein [Noviherbaspirillum sedimenti]RJG00814.1 hypothetical protein D3878_03790 [Noviherbaspirillum sedimenti]
MHDESRRWRPYCHWSGFGRGGGSGNHQVWFEPAGVHLALVTGILVNTQEGKRIPYLLAAAVLSALSLVATVLWVALLGEGVIPALSGVRVDLINKLPFAAVILSGLWFGSAVAVFVCAFSRPVTLGLLHNVISLDLDKAKKIELLLKVLSLRARNVLGLVTTNNGRINNVQAIVGGDRLHCRSDT